MEYLKNDLTKTNVAVLGDSIAKGLYYSKDGKLEQIENNCVAILKKDCNININNISVFGQTLKRACAKGQFDKYFETAKSGDKLIIELGANDSDFDWAAVELNPTASHTSKTTPDEFYSLLKAVVNKAQSKNIEVILLSLYPMDSTRYFNNVLARKFNGDKILEFLQNDVNNLYRHQEIFNALISKCARTCNCTFVDFRTQLLKQIDFLTYLCEDGIHPNTKGHEFVAELIKNKLK